MLGKLRDRNGTKGALVRSLNCLIDPQHSCVKHMSPIFPKRKFCEARSLEQAAWGRGSGGRRVPVSVMSSSEVVLLAGLGHGETGEQPLS